MEVLCGACGGGVVGGREEVRLCISLHSIFNSLSPTL